MENYYVPSTEEIKASATRLGEWTPKAFELWLQGQLRKSYETGWNVGYNTAADDMA